MGIECKLARKILGWPNPIVNKSEVIMRIIKWLEEPENNKLHLRLDESQAIINDEHLMTFTVIPSDRMPAGPWLYYQIDIFPGAVWSSVLNEVEDENLKLKVVALAKDWASSNAYPWRETNKHFVCCDQNFYMVFANACFFYTLSKEPLRIVSPPKAREGKIRRLIARIIAY
ncbi:MAG: hypothetical protein HY291_20805 [Planctomycetes bacterium]|nr:hypothetical protein [Planctomycetota bacterium]